MNCWIVRDSNAGNHERSIYSLFPELQSPQKAPGGRYWFSGTNNPDISIHVHPRIVDILRPDLVLPPGGGPVRIDPPDVVEDVAGRLGLRAVTRQRDALLAAAKYILDGLSPELENVKTWLIENSDLVPLQDAVALCEKEVQS